MTEDVSGVRTPAPPDLIDGAAVARELAGARSPFAFELRHECGSTNSVLMECARAAAEAPLALACEVQTAGRGRRGAAWHSGPASGLTFSVRWRFACGANGLSGLSLAAGVAMARAIESFGFDDIGLKWPNDLLRSERKLGGILIEMGGDARGPSLVVIGIGINVRMPPDLSARIDQPAIGLDGGREGLPVPSRTRLLSRALIELGASLAAFADGGFAPFRDPWMRRHAWRDRRISLRVAGRRIAQGVALGVDRDGALLLRTERGVERHHSGEPGLEP